MSEPASAEPARCEPPATPKRQLTLFDSTCIIVGIIIGAGIYRTAPEVARGAGCWWGVLLIWLIGGLLSLCGAFVYAELGTAYPRAGGDYVYLTRAYGRWAGFLFGWLQLAVVRPGDIAVMAFIFADYFNKIPNPLSDSPTSLMGRLYACSAVAVLTAINVFGVRQGKWTQNFLTVVKALGLLAIVVVGLVAPRAEVTTKTVEGFPLSVALIMVLYTFGGWNEMAYVAAEVKNPKRNIARALVLGTVSVTVLYLLVNVAYLYALGYTGLATSKAVATDVVSTLFRETGGRLISVIVCISALGAVNGLVFTGARISYAVGAEHRAFRFLGRWDSSTGTPARALILQGILAITLVLALGSFVEAILYAAAAVYLFYLCTTLAVVVLRWKEPDVERPYRVTGYPVTPFVFCTVCGFLIYGAFDYKPLISTVAVCIILLGLPIYWLTKERSKT
jgi:amino acid transporter